MISQLIQFDNNLPKPPKGLLTSGLSSSADFLFLGAFKMKNEKRCSKCKQSKSLSEFYKSNRERDGLQNWCKVCLRDYKQTEKGKATAKRYNHSGKSKAIKKRYRNSIRGHLNHIFNSMLRRCNNPKNADYKYYGGRCIKVLFSSFDEFYDYIVNVLKANPRGLTIDRIDNDGNYERGNIRFVTTTENNQNKRDRYAKREVEGR